MRSNMNRGPMFAPSVGEVTVETPDGVIKTEGTRAPSSMLNSGWAHGGFDGEGYGAFARDSDGNGVSSPCFGPPRSRFRVG